MDTWTMIKLIVALVVALGVGGTIGSYVWDYRHRGEVIEEQKIEIGNLKLENQILAKKEKAEKKVAVKKVFIKKQEKDDEKAIDEALATRDAANVLKLFEPYELHKNPDGLYHAPAGRKGRAQPALR